MLKPLLKKILILQIPIIVVGLIGWSLRSESEFFLIRDVPVEVEFSANQGLLVDSLRSELNAQLTPLKGLNIWKVSLSQVRDLLLNNPWIEQVEIRRSFPGQISTLIRLTPVAFLFVDHKNKIRPVTMSGNKLPQVKPAIVPVAPILRNQKIMKSQEQVGKIISLLNEVPNVGALRRENIASIDYKPTTGLTLVLVSGHETVHLGEKNISTKGLQVLRVTDYLKSQKQEARVIDASFTKKVLVRLRKRS